MSRQAELRTRPVGHHVQTARSTHVLPVDADGDGIVGKTLTARIAAAKIRLLTGGLMQPIMWGTVVPVVLPDLPDPRGRKTYQYSEIDAFIEQRPAVDRGTLDTDRADNTVLIILDPMAITDEHLFRWGDPLHTYKVSKVDGIVKNESTGVRFFSEVTVIR